MSEDYNMIPVRYAGFWIRVWASVVDSVLLLVIVTPPMYYFYGRSFFTAYPVFRGILEVFLNWIFPALAVILFWKYKSATPGKILAHLKIVDAKDFSALPGKRLLIRYLGYYVALIPFALGFFWVAFDRKKQGWHDKLAGSVVIWDTVDSRAVWSPLKIILISSLITGLLLAGLGGFGYRWLLKNKEHFSESLSQVKSEARAFAQNRDSQGCFEEALRRHDRCDGFRCHLENKFFLSECLEVSVPTQGFCDEVPSDSDILKSAVWRAGQCVDIGHNNIYCQNLFEGIQTHCDRVKE